MAAYLTARFAEDVMAGRWRGKKTVWIGPEEVGGELTQFPEGYDHLRAIPVELPWSKAASPSEAVEATTANN